MADVFISYARENQLFAQRVAEAVRREGYDVFWDDDLPPHLSYGEVITEKIGNARAAIVIWSKDAAASEWVRAEADLARSHKKLIQTSIDDHPLPMPFNQIQYAAIGDWTGEPDHPGWRKVRASLATLAGRQPHTVSPPAAPPLAATPAPAAPVALRRQSGAKLAAVLGGLVLVGAIGGGLYWSRASSRNELVAEARAPAANPAPAPPTQAPRPTTALFTRAATIDDPDGYTNVRSGPAATFPVIDRVNAGEIFTTYPQSAQWWQVRTADSRVGYMEGSRIRLVEPGATAAAPAPAGPSPAGTREASQAAPTGGTAAPPRTRTAQATPTGAKPAANRTVTPQIAQMRRYCNGGPGQGTPECRRFHRQMAAQQRQQPY